MRMKINPVIIGASQYTQSKEIELKVDPLRLMEKVCKDMFSKIKEDFSTLSAIIDSIYMVNINSWSYEDAPTDLSKMLGLTPKEKIYLPDGGNTPQSLVNRAAKNISSDKSKGILIVGAEAAYSAYQAKKGKITLNWPEKKEPEYMEGELWDGINSFENKYGLKNPPYTYALFETALRAENGRTIKEHQRVIGKLFSKFSKVASTHPYAWNQTSYFPEEIKNPSPNNRLITHPYTKRMCSNMFIDQAACILMTSNKTAQNLKIEQNSITYLMGGADLKDVHETTRRPSLTDSVPTRKGAKLALRQAGLSMDNIDAFDLYSCFPSIVEIMVKELGLELDDPRQFTLTGGLPYFGGPWSNYSMHGIVTAVHLIREDPSLHIMVIANGGYNNKKSIGIYGSTPPSINWLERDDSVIQEKILSRKLKQPVKEAGGIVTVEAYTIPYDRKGNPKKVIILGHLENGSRTLAHIISTKDELKELENEELVGKKFKIRFDPKEDLNMIEF